MPRTRWQPQAACLRCGKESGYHAATYVRDTVGGYEYGVRRKRTWRKIGVLCTNCLESIIEKGEDAPAPTWQGPSSEGIPSSGSQEG